MAGYAGTPLPKKLGIKAGHKVCLLNAPNAFERRLSAQDVRIAHDLRLPPVDVVVLFVDCIADLERRMADISARLHPAGGFWVAWSKKRRGSDVSEEVVRRIALACGMIDNKAVSIGDWDCVRLVLRAEHRDAVAYRAEPPPMLSRRVRRPTAPARIVQRSSGAGSTLLRARPLDEVGTQRSRRRFAKTLRNHVMSAHGSTRLGAAAARSVRHDH